ncbi:hypothetical protein PBY51_002101 [Eleginops maclovinus]|uniref:Uncharacterized protein n=1 Tax=Eleginops maclovinus TaxID=56733 RepID=A0AAN7WSB3_ELEMC|nr:hypothetical protein PBY51_002101 [Eleginops maclovinus]
MMMVMVINLCYMESVETPSLLSPRRSRLENSPVRLPVIRAEREANYDGSLCQGGNSDTSIFGAGSAPSNPFFE